MVKRYCLVNFFFNRCKGFRADASIFGALKKLDFEIFQLVTGTSATSFAADRSISIHLHLAA
ncbi:MAG: hypothetical protein AAF600_08580 [Bacteroidota bacterium]